MAINTNIQDLDNDVYKSRVADGYGQATETELGLVKVVGATSSEVILMEPVRIETGTGLLYSVRSEVVDLTNYYTKGETYSQGEVDTLIAEIDSLTSDEVYLKAETYSADEIDALLAGLEPDLSGLVTSVNGETGDVELSASDVDLSSGVSIQDGVDDVVSRLTDLEETTSVGVIKPLGVLNSVEELPASGEVGDLYGVIDGETNVVPWIWLVDSWKEMTPNMEIYVTSDEVYSKDEVFTKDEVLALLPTGGGGGVTSVNGETGDVELDAFDVPYNSSNVGAVLEDLINGGDGSGITADITGYKWEVDSWTKLSGASVWSPVDTPKFTQEGVTDTSTVEFTQPSEYVIIQFARTYSGNGNRFLSLMKNEIEEASNYVNTSKITEGQHIDTSVVIGDSYYTYGTSSHDEELMSFARLVKDTLEISVNSGVTSINGNIGNVILDSDNISVDDTIPGVTVKDELESLDTRVTSIESQVDPTALAKALEPNENLYKFVLDIDEETTTEIPVTVADVWQTIPLKSAGINDSNIEPLSLYGALGTNYWQFSTDFEDNAHYIEFQGLIDLQTANQPQTNIRILAVPPGSESEAFENASNIVNSVIMNEVTIGAISSTSRIVNLGGVPLFSSLDGVTRNSWKIYLQVKSSSTQERLKFKQTYFTAKISRKKN